jgi:HK97 family phage major capsid protein
MGQVTQRVRRIPIGANSNGIKINAVDESSRVNGSRWGGVLAYWQGEASLYTASQTKLRQMELDLKKLTGLTYATDELLQDAAALEGLITEMFPQEFKFKIEDAIINGTGSGQPLGILNGGALVTVAIEGSQTIANSATYLVANTAKMWARLADGASSPVWLMNRELYPSLIQMVLGGAGGATPVFLPAGSVTGTPFATLHGYPIIPVEYTAAVGTPGDLILCDLSQYLMIDKGSIKQQSSIHVRFLYDEMTFKFTYRADGQPTWNKPLTPKNGSATTSPTIVLGTRS